MKRRFVSLVLALCGVAAVASPAVAIPAVQYSFFTPGGPALTTVPAPQSIAFSPREQSSASSGFVAVGSGSADDAPIARFEIKGYLGLKPFAPSSDCRGSSVAFRPSGSILAVANRDTGKVALCTMSTANGSLAPLGFALPTGTQPVAVEFSPDGKLLVTLNRGGPSDRRATASMFRVTATGLEQLGDYDVGEDPTSATFSADSRFLVVTSDCARLETIRSLAIGADGALSEVTRWYPPGGCAVDSGLEPTTGRFIVLSSVGRGAGGAVATYALDAAGQPVAVGESLLTPDDPSKLAVSPGGAFFGYLSPEYERLTLLRRTADGNLAAVSTAPTSASPTSVSFSSDGGLIGVTTDGDSRIQLFRVAPGPTLLPMGAPTPLGGKGAALATAGRRVAVTTYNPQSVELYDLASDGGLTRTDAIDSTALPEPNDVALRPDGALLAVPSGSNDSAGRLSVFRVSADGLLTAASESATDGRPVAATFSPDGALLATANWVGGSVSLFSVTPDGVLGARHDYPAGSAPASLAFSPDGTQLLVADEVGSVLLFPVSGSTLGPAREVLGGGNPVALAWRPDGKMFAVINGYYPALLIYTIDAAGNVEDREGDTPNRAGSVTFSTDGGRLFVNGFPELTAYTVDADGALTRFGDAIPNEPASASLAATDDGKYLISTQAEGASVWVYPLAAPALKAAFSSGPSPFDRATDVPFEFTASYPSTFECRLDGAAFTACPKGKTFTVTTGGPHSVDMRAIDHAGNRSDPVRYAWIRDTTPPVAATLLSPAAGDRTVPTTTAFTWTPTTDSAAGVTSYDLLVDGADAAHLAAADCTAARCTVTPTDPLANGPHAWAVRATDAAGNSTTSAAREFSIDATPPVSAKPIAPAGDATVGSARPLFAWTPATDDGAGVATYDVLVDGAVATAGLDAAATAWVPPADLADGRHTWAIRATDRNGNRVTSPVAGFATDQTPPQARLVVRHEDATSDPGPPFFLGESITLDASTSTDPGGQITSYAWDLDGDGQPDPGATGPQVVKSLNAKTGGRFQVTVFVTDAGGHTSVLPYVIVVDATRYDVTFYATLEDAQAQTQVASFTRSETVYLRVNVPTEATAIQVGNQFGAMKVQVFAASNEPIKWTFNPFRDPKRSSLPTSAGVSVSFLRGRAPIGGNIYGSIGIDLSAPTVKAPTVSTAGPFPLLKGTVSDKGSGATEVQVTTSPRKSKKKFAKITGKPDKHGKTKLRQRLRKVRSAGKATGAADFVPGKPVYVRFKDATGNVSEFCLVSGKRPKGGPAKCKR
jgi:6-phosphogluconolactonase (cycloisomerase 2 family)